jgi:prepilin-type N-terminal cleavage/methylation domain-containing protein
MHCKYNRNHKGFTLIELLVVIAIIAILAAILFPVFARAREKARQMTCTSNQRQITASIMMYCQDYGETMPVSTTVWKDIEVDPGVLICPTAGKTQNIGYGYNSYLSNGAIGDVVDPTKAVVTMDCSATAGSTGGALVDFNTDVNARHSGGVVYSCIDGHVAWEQIKPTSNLVFSFIEDGLDLFPSGSLTMSDASTRTAKVSPGGWSRRGNASDSTTDTIADMPLLAQGYTSYKPNIKVEFDMSDSTIGSVGGTEFGSYFCLYNANSAFSNPGWTSLPVEVNNNISVGIESGRQLIGFSLYGAGTSVNKSFTYSINTFYHCTLIVVNGKTMYCLFTSNGKVIAELVLNKDVSSVMSNPKFAVIAGSGSSAKVANVKNLKIYAF